MIKRWIKTIFKHEPHDDDDDCEGDDDDNNDNDDIDENDDDDHNDDNGDDDHYFIMANMKIFMRRRMVFRIVMKMVLVRPMKEAFTSC